MKKLLFLLLAISTLLAFCAVSFAFAEERIKFEESEMYDGLTDENTKLVLAYYWEPRNSASIDEMVKLEKLYHNYRDKGLLIVGAYRETVDQASERLSSQIIRDDIDVTFPLVNIDNYTKYKTSTIPSAVFVDAEGNILPASMQEHTDFYRGNILDKVEQYKTGAFDEYRTNPNSAKTFEMFDAIIKDESKVDFYVEDLMNKNHIDKSAVFFSGTTCYNVWEQLVESRLP